MINHLVINESVIAAGVTREQAAAAIGISISTLGRLEKAGLIKPVKVSAAKARYTKEEIERYLNSINL